MPKGDEEVKRMGSRLVLGASTLALVVVASGGTAILVTQGTSQLPRSPLAAPPPGFDQPRPTPTPLVVPRAPGSALFGPSRPVSRPVAPPAQPVEDPVVDVPSVEPPAVEPPVVDPPVLEPPVVEPPVVEPPVVEPPVVEPSTNPGRGKAGTGRGPKSNNGHHYGQIKHPKG